METLLEIKGVNKHYKDFHLKDISFELQKGYIMGFIGPNGAGKSTTIKLIMNLIKKDSGQINIFGMDSIKNEKEIKERIGFVYDESNFYEELTIGETIYIFKSFYKNWDNTSCEKYLSRFGLAKNKKIKDLSRGMKTKFSLAVALSHNADLLIMDEPTAGLDPIVRNELLDILAEYIQNEEKSVLFSTHITSDLDKIADYITLISGGEIILTGTKDEIIENYTLIKGDKALLNDDNKNHFIGLKLNEFGFEGLIRNENDIKNMFGGHAVFDRPSLEDIMLYFAGGKSNA